MDIIINALYTHKDVFLRELISNASDALDKIRYLGLKDPAQLEANKELKIMIEFSKEDKTISVTDTGIGMTKEDLIKNLGTVAKSGTAGFVEALTKGDAANLIGQFGVGFYSTYLVAKQVVVASKHNDDDQYLWISQAGSQFSVVKDPKGNTLLRGTKVTLYLKEDAIELVDQETLKNIVKKYSEFINYPIYLYSEKEVTQEVAENKTVEAENKTAEAANKTAEPEKKEGDEKVEIKEEKKETTEEKKNQTITKKVWEWVLVNEQKALWLRNKEDIKDEEYASFFKTLTKGTEEPLAHSHIKAEGDIEFSAILYIPTSVPFDLFENYYGKSKSIKLYVKRVMVTEEFENLMPRYLNFIKGVLDSDDLPLNVNRELLQQQRALKVITKKLVRNAIKMIENLAKSNETAKANETEAKDANKTTNETSKYEKFWGLFHKNIKLGVIEDSSNRISLSKLLR
jgi:heat shock protein beta